MIFPKGIERAILWLPFIAIPAYAIEYISGVRWTLHDWNIASFLVATIGISGVHSLFTYSMFFRLPEFKKWRAEKTKAQPYLFPFMMVLIISTICLLMLSTHLFLVSNKLWVSVIGFFFTIYATHHTFSQSMGLSQVYTAKLFTLTDLTENERSQISCLQIREARIKKIWLPLQFATSTVGLLPTFGFKDIPYLVEAQWLFGSMTLSILAIFFMNVVRLEKIRKTNKTWFSLRLILYTFTPGSQSIALIYIIRAVHAFEYWGVYELAMQNSRANQTTKKQAAYLTASLMFVGVASVFFRKHEGFFEYLAGTQGTPIFWIVSFIAAVSTMQVSVHVFIDGLLFRMKNPHSRKWIFPLLLSK